MTINAPVSENDFKEALSDKKKRSPVWRRIFLYSLTSLVTIAATVSVDQSRGIYIDQQSFPISTVMIEWIAVLSELFLLVFSPFFFRRLGNLAVLGWIVALFVLFLVSISGRS
jgi:hypothetical protein